MDALQPKHAAIVIVVAAAVSAIVYVGTHLFAWHITHTYVTRGSYTRGGKKAYIFTYLGTAAAFSIGAAGLAHYVCRQRLPEEPMAKVIYSFFMVVLMFALVGLVLDLWLLGRFNDSRPMMVLKHQYPGPLASIVTMVYNLIVLTVVATILVMVYQPMGGSVSEGGLPLTAMVRDIFGRLLKGGPAARRTPQVCNFYDKKHKLLAAARGMSFLTHGFVADLEVELFSAMPSRIAYEDLYHRLHKFVTDRLADTDNSDASIPAVMVAFTDIILEGCPEEQRAQQAAMWGGSGPVLHALTSASAAQIAASTVAAIVMQTTSPVAHTDADTLPADQGPDVTVEGQLHPGLDPLAPAQRYTYIDGLMGALLAGWLLGMALI